MARMTITIEINDEVGGKDRPIQTSTIRKVFEQIEQGFTRGETDQLGTFGSWSVEVAKEKKSKIKQG